jgi:hypothetical protein
MHPLIGAILPVTGGAMMLGDGVTMEHPPLRPVCNFAHFGKLTNWDTAILKLGQRAFLNLNDSTDVGEPLDDHAR